MSRSGTTKSKIITRRIGNAKTARLTVFLRRFGALCFVAFCATWGATWVVLSGSLSQIEQWSETQSQKILAHAGFTVQEILVEGRAHTDAGVLRAIIGLERGDPLFAFDPADTKEMLERLAWVKHAHVERRLPGTIYIAIEERSPVALWQHKGKLRVIDADGVMLTDTLTAGMRHLPIVVGEEANKHAASLAQMLLAEPDIAARVEAAAWVGERRWDLKLKNGIAVRLPEGDMGLALSRLAGAQATDKILEKNLTVIDLREEGRIIIRTNPGEAQEYKASFKPGSNI